MAEKQEVAMPVEIENIAAVVNQYYQIVKIVPVDQLWRVRARAAIDELVALREMLSELPRGTETKIHKEEDRPE